MKKGKDPLRIDAHKHPKSGKKWTANDRKKAFTALDGNSKVNHNTFVCNTVKTMEGKTIPVFHIHGECERKHSMYIPSEKINLHG